MALSSTTWILSLKVVLISTGVFSLALLLKISVPLVLEFSVSQAPLLWNSFLSWLKPPYLYFVINGIIITIAASSRFHHSYEAHDHQTEQIPASKIPTDSPPEFDYEMKIRSDFGDLGSSVVVYQQETKEAEAGVIEEKSIVVTGSLEVIEDGHKDEFVISRSTWTPPKRMDSSEILSECLLHSEKPLVSSRFGHRKPVKSSPEAGRALRVTKPKRHETLEHTWKTITEGRAMPLTRHLKKSDTWENHGRQINVVDPVDPSLVKKSETFRDRTNYSPPPPVTSSPAPAGKLRKEPSLSQDELNRRVEAFIKKFNDEMRLQRQESLNQYKEMINRGSH